MEAVERIKDATFDINTIYMMLNLIESGKKKLK